MLAQHIDCKKVCITIPFSCASVGGAGVEAALSSMRAQPWESGYSSQVTVLTL